MVLTSPFFQKNNPTFFSGSTKIKLYNSSKYHLFIKKLYKVLYNFLLNKWYFDELYNFIFVEPIKKIGLFFWKKGDVNIIDRYGPDGLSRLVKIISNKAVNFQSGYLYHYAFVMLVGFSILLTYLILY